MILNLTLYSLLILLCLTLLSTNATTYNATLGMGQFLGTSDSLVSANGNFELRFFRQENPTRYYAGIGFKKVPKDNIVWVANRKHAASDSEAVLTVDDKDGNLEIKDDDVVYKVTNISDISSTHAMLLDSGNFVLLNNSNLRVLWQSFDHPTNTLVPGMKVGFDDESGTSWKLTSWASANDPSPGNFSLEVDASSVRHRLIIRSNSEIYWVGDELFYFTFQNITGRSNNATWDLRYLVWQGNYTSRLVLEVSGELNQQIWSHDKKQWVSSLSLKCWRNAACGNFGICNSQAIETCKCFPGFKPYDEDSWNKGDAVAGCVRKTELLCRNGSSNGPPDGFIQVNGVYFPSDGPLAFKTDNSFTCRNICSTNCNCVAYLYNISGFCLLWLDELLNLKTISVDFGEDNSRPGFYLKVAGSDLINRVSNARDNETQKCAVNATCGNFGICNPQDIDPCECFRGFKPNHEDSRKKMDKFAGCVRKTELLCRNGSSDGPPDGFIQFNRVSFPSDGQPAFRTENAFTCRNNCSIDCNCVAYAYNSSGSCLLWLDNVLNVKNMSVDVGEVNFRPRLYLKVAGSELIKNVSNSGNNPDQSQKKILAVILVISFVALLIVALFAYYCQRRKLRRQGENLLLFDTGMSMKVESSELTDVDKVGKVNKRDVKLPMFSFTSVSGATNNFSPENKLGEGGFGPVYKGKLLNGDDVAVKRLSARSSQGWEELKNEALLIAKLQHNNLVRILGCCIESDEKMLIYEFMPNKSLDFFLFDATKRKILDWDTRVRIIDGIAQGLLYLHQYSRFRIIHRDLKVSNILLDINMNPKISDFGLARLFGGNELQANTNRIVGT